MWRNLCWEYLTTLYQFRINRCLASQHFYLEVRNRSSFYLEVRNRSSLKIELYILLPNNGERTWEMVDQTKLHENKVYVCLGPPFGEIIIEYCLFGLTENRIYNLNQQAFFCRLHRVHVHQDDFMVLCYNREVDDQHQVQFFRKDMKTGTETHIALIDDGNIDWLCTKQHGTLCVLVEWMSLTFYINPGLDSQTKIHYVGHFFDNFADAGKFVATRLDSDIGF